MSQPIATYSFLPWLRQGLANRITAADHDPSVKTRAEVHIELELSGDRLDGGVTTQAVGRDVAMVGPGDVVGIEQRAIVRVEPADWTTDLEPNHLPHIEFYDEDFPWRYTPAAPDLNTGRLRPWIALVVLAEAEFVDGTAQRGSPLAHIQVDDASRVFPSAGQLWAWAHVHVDASVNMDRVVTDDVASVLPRLREIVAQDPDLIHSRIVASRRLAANEGYHAFLVPTFESGRLAGLGLDPSDSPYATHSAWQNYPGREQANRFPYYHRWFFRTGADGDFESLVRRLEPRPADPSIGTRPVDVQFPGSGVAGLSSDGDLGGVLRLGGALRVPRASLDADALADADRYAQWDQPRPHEIQQGLADLVNLGDDYRAIGIDAATGIPGMDSDSSDPDPIVTPPLYGAWHALQKRLLSERDGTPVAQTDGWTHDLNLDPMHRTTAGIGTSVVQDNQERYADAAWEQVGDVLAANRRIRHGQLAREVSTVWYRRHLEPLLAADPETALGLIAPVAGRVIDNGVTVRHRLNASTIPPALLSPAMRRITRPGGPLVRRLDNSGRLPVGLVTRTAAGEVSAAGDWPQPNVVTVDDAAAAVDGRLAASDESDWLLERARRWPWLRWGLWLLFLVLIAVLVVAVILGAQPAWLAIALILLLTAFGADRRISRWRARHKLLDVLRQDGRTPDAVDAFPKSADFVVSAPSDNVTVTASNSDSDEAMRFKQALRGVFDVMDQSANAAAIEPRMHIDPIALAGRMVASLDPRPLIARRVLTGLHLPPRILTQLGERFVEVMAYPEFDTPMYEPLVARSAELFLPNIERIPRNSITLLEPNQQFIEAYLVGLNHEFSRELLWRGYPSDLRGSYFRQFWDVSSVLDDVDDSDDDARRERLRDIPELHRWPRGSRLGANRHRQPASGGDGDDDLVLAIRGDLLQRYPHAVIYARRAMWQRREAVDGALGTINRTLPRYLAPIDPSVSPPSRDVVRTPLYEASVQPDIHFFGFDLTVSGVQGGTGGDPNDDPGWFFVIEERPGEPRFGLDVEAQATINTWSELAWGHVQSGPAGSHIDTVVTPPSLAAPTGGTPTADQHDEDRHVQWDAQVDAADLAYILLRTPVRMAVHATELLRSDH